MGSRSTILAQFGRILNIEISACLFLVILWQI